MPEPNQEQNQDQPQKNPHRVAPKWYESNIRQAKLLLKDHDLWPPRSLNNSLPLTLDLSKDLCGKNGVVDLLAKSIQTRKNSVFYIFANTVRHAYRRYGIVNADLNFKLNDYDIAEALSILQDIAVDPNITLSADTRKKIIKVLNSIESIKKNQNNPGPNDLRDIMAIRRAQTLLPKIISLISPKRRYTKVNSTIEKKAKTVRRA